jgi:hypothetical protein
MHDLVIPLPNGGSLRCGEGVDHQWGGDLRICDTEGFEILMWTADEWRDEPEEVIGAAFSAALKPIAELTKDRYLSREDGIWYLMPKGA